MIETTITLKPEEEWRLGMTYERLVRELDEVVRLPGVTNAWTMPIKGRIDMLATGIRTAVGIKIFGPDLDTLQALGEQAERIMQSVPGTRSAFAERGAVTDEYLEVFRILWTEDDPYLHVLETTLQHPENANTKRAVLYDRAETPFGIRVRVRINT